MVDNLINHVFVLMLENRSFDHMLGFSPITGTDAETGRRTSTLRLSGSEQNIDSFGTPFRVTSGAAEVMRIGPNHEFEDVLAQLAGPSAAYPQGGPYPPVDASGYVGDYEEHVAATIKKWKATIQQSIFLSEAARAALLALIDAQTFDSGEVMQCFSPDQLPILNQLAREFAVCDNWYSSLPGPTFPNRFFMHAASSGGLDHSPSGPETAWYETVDGFDFPNGSIYDALDRAGLRYRFYAGDDLPVVSALSGVSLRDIHDFDEHFAEDMRDHNFRNLRYVHLEPSYDAIFGDFRDGTSQHPLANINKGELFIKQAYEAIRNSPLWESSILIITWDEHGGFYDHVLPPPAVPPNDGADDHSDHGFVFDRLGPRVPAIIVSPLIAKNVIDHRVYDHASIPAAIERIFGLKPLTDRDRAVNAPNSLLTLKSPRSDTPTTLGPVAITTQAVALSAPETPAQPAEPIIDPSVTAFVHVAAIQDLKMTTDPTQRQAIVANAKTIVTYGQAQAYTRAVPEHARIVRGVLQRDVP